MSVVSFAAFTCPAAAAARPASASKACNRKIWCASAKNVPSSSKATGRKNNKTAVVAAVSQDSSSTSITKPFEAMVEFAATQHPVASNRSDSFARTRHFTASCEAALNEQINIEYNVSYIYHAMYAYFSRDNVYLPGLAKHFHDESLEERGHAELLMNYMVTRGGRVELQGIMPPQVDFDHPEKGDALYAFELSLSLEKLNNDRLIALHRVAEEACDTAMMDFIEGELLKDQVLSIQHVSEYVAQLRRMGNKGDAVWHFDQMMLNREH